MSYFPEEPTMTMTLSEVDMLSVGADLERVRLRNRSGDTRLYALLVQIHQFRLRGHARAVRGTAQRQEAASEEREYWTIHELHKATGRAERTIRKDIEIGQLPATKTARAWIITDHNARAYIAGRKKN